MTHLDTPIETLAAAVHSACLVDLPEIKYRDRDWEKYRKHMDSLTRDQKAEYLKREKEAGQEIDCYIDKSRRPRVDDVEVVAMFPQMWGSTALGFGGIGGAAITTAYTVVIYCQKNNVFAVYFAGRFAYLVQGGSKLFMEDINRRSLAAVKESGKYRDA